MSSANDAVLRIYTQGKDVSFGSDPGNTDKAVYIENVSIQAPAQNAADGTFTLTPTTPGDFDGIINTPTLVPGFILIRDAGGNNPNNEGWHLLTAITGDPTVSSITILARNGTFEQANISIGNYSPLEYTSETLQQEDDKRESQIVTPERGIRDLVRNGIRANGDLNTEMTIFQADLFMRLVHTPALDQQAVRSANRNRGSIAISGATDGARTFTVATGAADGLRRGDVVHITAQTGTLDPEGYYIVEEDVGTAGTATTFKVMQPFTSSGPLSAATAEGGQSYRNGNVNWPIGAIERQYADLPVADGGAPRFLGMNVDTFQVSAPVDDALTTTATLLGSREVAPTPVDFLDSNFPTTPTLPTNDLNGPPVKVMEAQLAIAAEAGIEPGVVPQRFGCVNSGDVTWRNNLREKLCWGTLGAVDHTQGTFATEFNLEVHYDDATEFDKHLANTDTSMLLVLRDTFGTGATDFRDIVVWLPRCRYQTGTRTSDGRDQDVFATVNGQALWDSVTGIVSQMVIFPDGIGPPSL